MELLPDGEALGLLAMMLLTDSRRAARLAADGSIVLFADQDRQLWDRARIAEGEALVRQALALQLQGAGQGVLIRHLWLRHAIHPRAQVLPDPEAADGVLTHEREVTEAWGLATALHRARQSQCSAGGRERHAPAVGRHESRARSIAPSRFASFKKWAQNTLAVWGKAPSAGSVLV